MLQFIDVNKISAHPDNPRKELGDLTELAKSIKAKGILQNLTVVPWFSSITREPADDGKMDDHYVAVIGHRRLAAAKLAGLTEVPCIVITDMSPAEQVATMLLENMQRNDLTFYEQAQGIQLMLNFGETVNDISEKTGLSETTVRRRVKLLELDQEKFKKSVDRGGTLFDFAELDKIKNIDLRNSVLEKIGTQNFKWELQRAIDKEANDKKIALLVAEMEKFATKIKDSQGMQYVKSYYASQDNKIDIPKDADTTDYFFVVSNYGSVTLYTKLPQINPNTIQDDKQKEIRELRAELDRISKQSYQLRREFVFEIPNTKASKNINVIIEHSLRALLDDDYGYIDYEGFAEALNVTVNEDDELKYDYFADLITAQPARHLLIATYLTLDSERERYYNNWNNDHNDNETLNTVYSFLEKLGYQISDEEQALRDGTHRLFSKAKEE